MYHWPSWLQTNCWASALIDMVSSARIASMTSTWEGLRSLVATVKRGGSWSQMLKTGKIMKLSSYLSTRYSHHISAWNFYHTSQHEAVIIYQHFLVSHFSCLAENMILLPQVSHHGHSHAHSHLHSAPRNISSVAWMVICGDGIHNLADGFV